MDLNAAIHKKRERVSGSRPRQAVRGGAYRLTERTEARVFDERVTRNEER